MLTVSLLLLGLICTQLSAALAGVPEIPVPGRSYPKAWLLMSNDDMGFFGDMVDDHRTASFNFGYLHKRWLTFADYAILTDKKNQTRVDELTLSVGYLMFEPGGIDLGLNDRFQLVSGIGLRISDNLSGESLQNWWHDTIDAEKTVLPYEKGKNEGLLWFSADWHLKRPLLNFGNMEYGIATSLRGLVTTQGTAKVSPTAHAVVTHDFIDLWAGARYEIRGGSTTTQTKDTVFSYEDGLWISYGLAPSRFFLLQGGYNTHTRENFGTFGLIWPARTEHHNPSE